MRSLLISIALVAVGLLASATPAAAQFDCFNYSNDLDAYTDVSSDDTTVYADVWIDGSQQMNAWGQCAQFVGYAVHTPTVLNQLRTAEQTVGGYYYGDGVCASCYISYGTEEYITPLPSEEITFINEVTAGCSFGSTFFDSGFLSNLIQLVVSYGSLSGSVTDGDTRYCSYNLACTPGTTATCGAPTDEVGADEWCDQWVRTTWREKTLGGVTVCVGYTRKATGPGPCS